MTVPGSPTFVGVHLSVRDVRASLAFYRCAGLDVPDPVGGGAHAEIDLGNGLRLALSSPEVSRLYDPGWREPQGAASAALQFDLPTRAAVDETYDRLVDAGYAGHLAPTDAFWGSRYAEVDDPDGNIVGFHSPVDATLRA
jgi:uncharacterized glyoxalase superfamily protein PhnB